MHEQLTSKLSKLPSSFPVTKSFMNTEAVKRQRVEALQEYLRNCVRLCSDRPPPGALLKFCELRRGARAAGRIGRRRRWWRHGRRATGGPILAFEPFSSIFVPERPEDVNEGLREAIKAGDNDLCMELLKQNADPNYRDRQGNTPLHMAALFQRTDVAKALLLAGSDLTLKNGAGELPERMASVSLKMKFTNFKTTGQV